jgi:nucleolar protein 56
MANKYIFSNLIGCFVIDNNFKIVDSIEFKDVDDFLNKDKFEEKLIKKFKKVERIEANKVLHIFKDKKYFSLFYSRNLELTKRRIKKSVGFDNLIIQCISNIEELDRVINTLVKRLREWYELYNPEFSHSVNDNEKFVELIVTHKDRKGKDSMGAELAKDDLDAVMELAKEAYSLFEYKKKQISYLERIMKKNTPNLIAVAGVTIGAKLISLAGSLKKMVGFPSSTIQLLGAEKALFRHLRNKKRNLPPKFGILHEHPLISKVKKNEQGKVARALADKISLAAKVDYFKGEFIGDRLRKELEERFG